MRCRRAIRTVLVYALLGAGATVLSSWAIHSVQFARLRSSPSPPTLAFAPIFWPVDRITAHAMEIDTAVASGELGVDTTRGLWQIAPEADLNSRYCMATAMDINADAAWRRHRWPSDRLPPLPDYPFPYKPFEVYPRPIGVRLMGSETDVMSEAFEPPRGLIDERLFLVRAGWPLHAVSTGAHYAQAIENHAPPPPGHPDKVGHARVEQLAAPPAVSLLGGIELWHEPYPPIATGNASAIAYRPLDRFALPLLPLWPGFAINTGVYALLLFALVRTPRVLRRALRRRGGRCVGCGYDRAVLDRGVACPECGVQVA
ncbi:MAG: hypothetical protein NCW75_05290 [Phycisphaera sp.]|nr:MAG: hypothetical protein NCW75_05290 [Phycisphaera sp.]